MINRFANTAKITIAQLKLGFKLWTENLNFVTIAGPSGDGKTEIAATELPEVLGIEDPRLHTEGGDVYLLNYTDKGPQEAAGYGKVNDDGIHMDFTAPRDLPTVHRVKNTGNGDINRPILLILDEFSLYDSTVQGMIRPLQARKGKPMFGTHELAPNIRILLTGNRIEDGSQNATDPDQAILTRGKFFIIDNNFTDWYKWAITKDWAVQNDILTYLSYVKSLGDTIRTDDGETRLKIDEIFKPTIPMSGTVNPTACPRQWENVCREFKSIQDMNITDSEKQELLRMSLNGAVGINVTEDIMSFIESIKDALPKYQDVRNDLKSMADFSGIDAMAVLSIAAQRAIKEAKKISGSDKPEQIKKDTGHETQRGSFDWFTDKFIGPATNKEMARFALENVQRFIPLKDNS
tara:strand:- start:1031 stop:2248 length:1218 start_codon:yes stop_codon:yes gene_type:complete